MLKMKPATCSYANWISRYRDTDVKLLSAIFCYLWKCVMFLSCTELLTMWTSTYERVVNIVLGLNAKIKLSFSGLRHQHYIISGLNDHLFGKELFIRFTASAFRKLLSVYVFSYFLLVLRAGCGIWMYQFLIIACLVTLSLFVTSPDCTSSSFVGRVLRRNVSSRYLLHKAFPVCKHGANSL